MKLLFIAIIFAIAPLVSVAQDSPSPTPTPGKEGQPGQEPGANENQKAGPPDATSKDSPFLINCQYSAVVGKTEVQDSSGQPSQPPSDNRIVWLTAVLAVAAVIQLFIYGKQAYYMNEGLKVTRQSAKAAQDSAESALKQAKIMETGERPWMIVTPGDPDGGWPVRGAQSFLFRFKWTAKNIGRSPAFLTRLSVDAKVIVFPIPDVEPPYPNTGIFAKFVIPPNGRHNSRVIIELTQPQVESFLNGQAAIVFYGIIDYYDPLGGSHQTRFYTFWGGGDNVKQFSPVGPPNTVDYT